MCNTHTHTQAAHQQEWVDGCWPGNQDGSCGRPREASDSVASSSPASPGAKSRSRPLLPTAGLPLAAEHLGLFQAWPRKQCQFLLGARRASVTAHGGNSGLEGTFALQPPCAELPPRRLHRDRPAQRPRQAEREPNGPSRGTGHPSLVLHRRSPNPLDPTGMGTGGLWGLQGVGDHSSPQLPHTLRGGADDGPDVARLLGGSPEL